MDKSPKYDLKITGLAPYSPVDVPEIIINGKQYVFDAERFGDATQGYTDSWGEVYITLKEKEQ